MAYIDSSTNNTQSLLPGPSKPSSDGPRITEVPDDNDTESEEESSEEGVDLVQNLIDQIDKVNIAEEIDEQDLNKLGALVVREYEIDENSRSDWKDEAEKALKFANQETQEKQYPWPKACLSLDTDILTQSGWKPIGDVQVGEFVYSRALNDGAAAFFPVSKTFRYKAEEVVRFSGKSIDLLATPNHRMLVSDRDTGLESFIEAGEFAVKHGKGPNGGTRLSRKSIPLTSEWVGASPAFVYGIPAMAYVRFLGWFVAEGCCNYASKNIHVNKAGEEIDYGPSTGGFSIAQSKRANPEKYSQICRDIEACGFTYREYEGHIGVHARSMPSLFKAELRSLGKVYDKRLPRHVLGYNQELLGQLLETMLAGDGHIRNRHGKKQNRLYFTTSTLLADQVQEISQKLGLRGTIAVREARLGGVINGRQITGLAEGYDISINSKPTVQVLKLKRELTPYNEDVACVEVEPHHTIYVRRNGKAVWVGNSNIIYPLITTAATQFAARTYPAIIQNRNVVKGVVWGSDKGTPVMGQDGNPMVGPDGQPVWLEPPGAKRLRADRIGGHMSYQLLEEMPEWEPQVDTLLHMIPIVGGAARKTYYDPIEDRNYSLLVSLLDLVWNYHAKSFESAPRHTELLIYYPVEIEEFERAGLFLEIEYGLGDATSEGTKGGGGDSQDDDAPHLFLEQHRTYDLDGDGYPEPYVVTVHKKSSKVVRIVARYDADGIIANQEEGSGDQKIVKIKPVEHYTLIPFMPNPSGGSYPMGFGKLLRPLNESINTSLNQMFDAGHLQNAGGGFIGTSLSIASGPVSFQVGKYIPVNNKGQAIRDAVFPLPFPGPSGVLFQLLGTLLQAGKDVASIQDVMTGDSSMANQPPTTILALIEQGMKLYTAIHKRVYRALKSEFQKLYRLNLKRIKRAERFRVGDEWLEVTPDDYRQGGGVEPIADPTMVTDMQKLGRAQILMQFLNDPLINQLELRRRFLDAAMFDRIDELLITQPQMSPADQLKMQEIQVNISRQRAAELKDTTQAVLNLAQSRKIADEKEMAWIDQQLEVMKMHVEAANTMVKAADVELRSRDRVHATRVAAHTQGTQEAKRAASNVIGREPSKVQIPFGTGGNPVQPVEAPPGNGSIPQIPQGQGGLLPS